jgi:predicted DNA-binding transcriptional regulator YafY
MPRYARVHDILRLVLDMQASAEGLTLEDVMGRFEVDRRTATRMRDAAVALFPDACATVGPDRRKRWRIPNGAARALVRFEADELAALEHATKRVERDGRPDHLAALRSLATKVRGVQTPAQAARVEPDLEALTAAEGLAARPGPRVRVDRQVLADLRLAILACRKVRLHYTKRDGERVRHKLYPYGFLQGNRHYLVAWSRPAGKHLLYRLGGVERVEVLDETFERDPAFDLQKFAAQSFGVFQEEPVDVVWRFRPTAARDAREFQFHPTQMMEEQPDGSLVVRFRAGGLLEMAWHLFTWGDQVEVVEPGELRGVVEQALVRRGGYDG